ncbi:MAG: hypothetical protein CMH49_00090 [Myxococcales bacterium]|nr:hypothetical protein [Myxococcales bacterium]
MNQDCLNLVIGAGLAGLSTLIHSRQKNKQDSLQILEAADHVGGKARSEQIDGFTFDVTGHWLHLRDDKMRALVIQACGEEHFAPVQRLSRVWSHGVYTRYPFQANVHGLPPQVVHECVMGAVEARLARPDQIDEVDEPERFSDWVRFYFGEGIAKHFMIPYNAKLWGVSADEITSRWCQRFVPRPKLESIVAGAVGCHQDGMGYNATFLYPKQGGIQTVAEHLADLGGRSNIQLNTAVESIEPFNKTLTLLNGKRLSYHKLVNTMPLPDLIDRCTQVPNEVRAARSKLRATEVIYLNVGIEGKLGQADHWIYVPEERWPMYRVGSFTNAMPTMAPDGHSSLYIELSDRERSLEQIVPEVIEGLIAMKLIDHERQVKLVEPRRIPNAYVIYDEHYHEAREIIHEWLTKVDILSVGRYGDWNYSSMEDALLDGKRASEWLYSEL